MKTIKAYSCILLVIFSPLLFGQSIANHDAIKGCLFGGAMGDAMGKPTEFIKSVEKIYARYPQGIKSFEDFKAQDFEKQPNGKPIAAYTDDTAMSLVTMKTLLEAHDHNWDLDTTMSNLAINYVKDMENNPNGWAAPYRAPGNTCLLNCKKLEKILSANTLDGKARRSLPSLKARISEDWWARNPGWWQVADKTQGGCGSVMRAHPFGIVFAHDPEKAAAWAAEHSKITHGAPMAQAACAAMAKGVALALAKQVFEGIYYSMIQEAHKYDKETALLMDKAVGYAIETRHKIGSLDGDERWAALLKLSEPVYKEFLGWDARTAIAATMYTFAVTYGSDVKKAIYLGVHTPGDSDSIASMSGALVGAMDGFKQLKKGWEKDLEMLEGNEEISQLADMALVDNNKQIDDQVNAQEIHAVICA